MERVLSEGGFTTRHWLVGDRMTLADINLMPFVARLAYLKLLDLWIEDRPRVQAWWRRVQEQQSFIDCVPGRLAADELAAMGTFGTRIRDRVGERRREYLAAL